MRAFVGIVFACLAVSPASAQHVAQVDEDVMEAQRCIWRCQAEYGNDWKAYEACTVRNCAGDAPPDETPPEQEAAPVPPPLTQPSPLSPQQSLKPGSRAPSAGSGSLPSASAGGLSAVPSGSWRYGNHPVLGPSAYVETDEGTVSLACAYFGESLAVAHILSLRVTGSLVSPGTSTIMFPGSLDTVRIEDKTGSGYTEQRGDTCDMAVSSFRSAPVMILVPGNVTAVNDVGTHVEITLDIQGRQTVVTSGDEAARLPGSRLIPLKGSSAAIGKLIAACPAARLDIENNCGI